MVSHPTPSYTQTSNKRVNAHSNQNQDAKPELVTTTVRDYDLDQTGKAMKGLFTGIAFMAFLVSFSKPPLTSRKLTSLSTVT